MKAAFQSVTADYTRHMERHMDRLQHAVTESLQRSCVATQLECTKALMQLGIQLTHHFAACRRPGLSTGAQGPQNQTQEVLDRQLSLIDVARVVGQQATLSHDAGVDLVCCIPHRFGSVYLIG